MKPTIEEVRRDTRTSCLSDESKAVIYAALDVAKAQADCGHRDDCCAYGRFRATIRPTPSAGSTSGGK